MVLLAQVGAFVEVRNVDDGFQNSWASAKVLKAEKKSFTVPAAEGFGVLAGDAGPPGYHKIQKSSYSIVYKYLYYP